MAAAAVVAAAVVAGAPVLEQGAAGGGPAGDGLQRPAGCRLRSRGRRRHLRPRLRLRLRLRLRRPWRRPFRPLLPGLRPVVIAFEEPIDAILHPAAQTLQARTAAGATLATPGLGARARASPGHAIHKLPSRRHPLVQGAARSAASPAGRITRTVHGARLCHRNRCDPTLTAAQRPDAGRGVRP